MKTDNPYQEAMRYIENARETLKLAGKDGKFYEDEKYVKTGCGTAYSGLLLALDLLFDLKGMPKSKGRKKIDYYRDVLSKLDKKMLDHLNVAYNVLHLDGYYDGIKSTKVIEEGINEAIALINLLKPYSITSEHIN